VAPGGMYTVAHTRGGFATSVGFIAPARPVILAPTTGATIARSKNVTITYVSGSGSAVRATAGDGQSAGGGVDQPDDGSYDGFDVTSLRAGPGTVSLIRDSDASFPTSGFHAARAHFSVSSVEVPVTWN